MLHMLDLEKALESKCQKDPQYATLWAQWTFDKQLVGRALQSVASTFPHFSRHDASHSDTILRQIARVLGPVRVARLGPTDLWMLLETAYFHDVGMVVDEHRSREWWSEPQFCTFLEELKNHSDDHLRAAAELLDKHSTSRPAGGTWPFDVHRALVLVMAEYARPRHPRESRRIADMPSLIDLQSPRTQLVPRRFWTLVGRICESHGLSFTGTMSLPARESGFAMDDAHPRFVACMLRLGDLLDLDDGRFCPVLARTFGGLPPSSLAHKEKHHSIVELLVDASEVRVVAECDTPAAFDVTEQWFAWLREELRDQSVRWSEICPEPDFGAVPSAGRIEARLLGYHTSPDGKRPRFDVDKATMLDFVRGAGLYEDETACVAELLQNAVDATLLRVWKSGRRKWRKLDDEKTPDALAQLREHLKRYPIDVRVRKVRRAQGHNHWSVEIRDRGAGISREDIRFLQCVGSSRKNPRRKERVRGMPEWMRPSGYFGIGLQSVFLFTDRVVIRSRADDGMETVEVELSQSLGTTERQILVRDARQPLPHPGTSIRFILKAPIVPASYSYSGEHAETRRIIEGYDPLLDPDFPILPSKIRDSARIFARNATARVRVDGIDVARANDDGAPITELYFDASTGIEMALGAGPHGHLQFLFRGRSTKDSLRNEFFTGSVDWYQGNASEVLTINREKIRRTAADRVEEAVERAVLNVLPRYHHALQGMAGRQEERRYLSLAAEVDEGIRSAGVIPQNAEWRDIEYNGSGTTLGRIVDASVVRIVEDSSWTDHRIGPGQADITWSQDGATVTIACERPKPWLLTLLRKKHWVLEGVEAVERRFPGSHWRLVWAALNETPPDVGPDVEVLRFVISLSAAKDSGRARRTFPCYPAFRAMAIAADAEIQLPYTVRVLRRLTPRAVFPFRIEADGTITLAGVDELIQWTWEHRAQQTTTKPDIARAVLEFVEKADETLRDEWGTRVEYDTIELRRRFTKAYGSSAIPPR